MWIDSASSIDMLSYKPFSELLYKIVKDKRMNPLTIGLYGSWGAGKSTILKLTENIIEENNAVSDNKIFTVNINSWMLEGYDDTKCALMESLLKGVEANPNFKEECKEGLKGLFKRIDFLRLGATALKKGAPLALSVATGNPMPFMLNLSEDLIGKFKTEDGVQDIYDGITNFSEKYIKPKENEEKLSVVENIRVFKSEFEKILEKAEIDNLVVMIDDLDRCTPDKIIDTLEAIKLFLSVKRTTFIIAVDERVIKYSIKKRYPAIDADSVDISKDYIEKIIQLPISIPELSEIDIMNYMLLLANELYLEEEILNKLINKLYEEGTFYNGSRITVGKIFDIINISNTALKDNKEYIELVGVIEKTSRVVAGVLKGNPRQAKRFLNTFLVRKSMAEIYYGNSNNIKIEILAKLLSLEYIDIDLFKKLNEWNNKSDGAEIEDLKILLDIVKNDKEVPSKYALWDTERIKKWIISEPQNIYECDLSKYFYLCREALSGESNTVENLNNEEREILNKILKANTGKEKEEILKLKEIHPDSSNKIIKVMVKMFKEKNGRLINIGIIYQNFEQWRFEILEHLKSFVKTDIKMDSIPYLQMIYQCTPKEMDEILVLWKQKKYVDDKKVNFIKGVK
ncbi:Predicted P-loop ATPase [uncultured Clostridium sp.]|uniref:KAP family P-loop NTPase fold protein n=1 Tax=uncultured Clostridium sp. TaxID=59620 RepID=UPI00082056C1|nr:P-loop NTPase fold protein [uncultured Clostridium sp.]SCJ99835.1 Predicted P-loop ATPase [uncultured Clostridium sp.]